jgi:hypothetical protein
MPAPGGSLSAIGAASQADWRQLAVNMPSTRAAAAVPAKFLDTAERDMTRFPGRDLMRGRSCLRDHIEYRDAADFDHLLGALGTTRQR